MDVLRSEIDEENELIEQTKQLEAEVKNAHATMQPGTLAEASKYSSEVVPTLYARLNDIKQRANGARKRRRMVKPTAELGAVEVALKEVGDSLQQTVAQLTERKQQSDLETMRRMVQELQQNPALDTIEVAESKLEQLSFSNDAVQELRQTLRDMKHKQTERHKIKQTADKHLAELAQKLDQMREKYPGAVKETKSKKRKKGQQQQQAKPSAQSRKDEIHELRRNVDELKTVVIPALVALNDQLASADIQSTQPNLQASQADELVQVLTVSRVHSHIHK